MALYEMRKFVATEFIFGLPQQADLRSQHMARRVFSSAIPV